MSSSNTSKILELFDNPTVSQISMYLLFYNELSAGELAKLAKKNISTITRSLEKMSEENLISVSKIEAKGNLQVKFWSLNPEIINIDTLLTDETLNLLPAAEKEKAIERMHNILKAFRRIIMSIYDYRVKNLITSLQNQNKEEDSSIITIFLFGEETGRSFEKEFKKFQRKFFEEHREDPVGLDKVNPDNIILFMLSSRLGDVIPRIKRKKSFG